MQDRPGTVLGLVLALGCGQLWSWLVGDHVDATLVITTVLTALIVMGIWNGKAWAFTLAFVIYLFGALTALPLYLTVRDPGIMAATLAVLSFLVPLVLLV